VKVLEAQREEFVDVEGMLVGGECLEGVLLAQHQRELLEEKGVAVGGFDETYDVMLNRALENALKQRSASLLIEWAEGEVMASRMLGESSFERVDGAVDMFNAGAFEAENHQRTWCGIGEKCEQELDAPSVTT